MAGGHLAEHPGYLSAPDEETVPLIPSLAALNRAGLVTDFSQPGAAGPHSGGWQQRAAVSGLCSYSTSALLHERLATAGLVVFAQRRDAGVRIPVTVVDREPHTWVGAVPPLEDLALLYTGTATGRACELVASGWYVTAFDPIWARNDQLWPALATALMAAAEDGA